MNQTGSSNYGGLLRLAIILLLVLLIAILLIQNQEPVETKILFTSIEMPRAALIFSSFFIGLLTGILGFWASISRWRRAKAKSDE